MTLEEDFVLPLLLLNPIVPSELQDDDERALLDDAVLTLLLDPLPSVEDDKAEDDAATFWLLLDSGAELGMTEEEDLPLTLEEDFALPLPLLDCAEPLLDSGSELGMTSESITQSPSSQT